MASYYQQKAERQKILRSVKAQERAVDTMLERLERELTRLRKRKNILDASDVNRIVRLNDDVKKAQAGLDNAITNFTAVLKYE